MKHGSTATPLVYTALHKINLGQDKLSTTRKKFGAGL